MSCRYFGFCESEGLFVVLVLGGVVAAVQTLVAQSQGARRYRRAAQAAWTALWGTLCAVPLFVAGWSTAAFPG